MKRSKVKKNRLYVIIVCIIAVILIACGCGIQYFNFTNYKKEELKNHQKLLEEKKLAEQKKNAKREYKASLVMVGDSLIHSSIYQDARLEDGSYDFKPMLQYIKPLVQNYDIRYYNQETILGGVELGLSNYPRFNSPYEVGDAFIDAGFNLVSLATNHTMDKGEKGVINSLNYWNSKTSVVTAGSYLSFDDKNKVKIVEINGIKYAFFSYTTWNNGLSTPIGKEYLNDEYSFEKAKADIERVRDLCDIVIVAMHWGTEYSMGVSDEQTVIANELSSLGVGLIIGSHPHVIEPIEYINDGKTLVIYSLGNFISDQVGIDRLSGLMIGLDIKKVVENKVSTVSLENVKASLLYTKSNLGRSRDFRVYPYSQLNSVLLPNYKQYYEKYKGILTSRWNGLQIEEIGG